MELSPTVVSVMGVLVGFVPGVIAWLTSRTIKGIDDSIQVLRNDVASLRADDLKILIELTDLRARVTALEKTILQRREERHE